MITYKEILIEDNSEINSPIEPEKNFNNSEISKDDLYRHCDSNGDGIVDFSDLASTISFHVYKPHYLEKHANILDDIQKKRALGEIVDSEDPVLKILENTKAIPAQNKPEEFNPESNNTNEALHSDQFSVHNPIDLQNHAIQYSPPATLILQRKSIRQYPTGERIALYYCSAIDKYFTVGYDGHAWSGSPHSESFIKKLENISDDEIVEVVFKDSSTLNLNKECADNIIKYYNHININDKPILEQYIKESSKNFLEILEYSVQDNNING